jgi:hypothetical protein
MYVSSMRDASVTEMGVEDTLWLGGGASSDILRVCRVMQKVGEGEEVAMVVELVTFYAHGPCETADGLVGPPLTMGVPPSILTHTSQRFQEQKKKAIGK